MEHQVAAGACEHADAGVLQNINGGVFRDHHQRAVRQHCRSADQRQRRAAERCLIVDAHGNIRRCRAVDVGDVEAVYLEDLATAGGVAQDLRVGCACAHCRR